MTASPVIVAVIQARMSSSRLPGKVLMDLGGRPVLDHAVAAARCAPGIDRVAIATSTDPSDNPIAAYGEEADVRVHRGPLADVLGRFGVAVAAEDLQPGDAVMRLTADCPLLDATVLGLVAERFRSGGVAFVSNTDPVSWPDGLDCELFRVDALRAAVGEARRSDDREHVGPFIRRNLARFPAANIRCPSGQYEMHRWTLDTPADLEFLRRVVTRLPTGQAPSFAGVMAVLRADHELMKESLRPHAQHRHNVAASLRSFSSLAGYDGSNRRLERAKKTVPLGSQTFSKSHIQFPEHHAPMFVTHGSGGRLFDVDGNEYVDMIGGLLPVVLGYRDPDVDEAVRRQLDRGISFSMATDLEADLAERLARLIPCVEMVRYGKNGSDATTAAVRIARAATGRERIAVCGYHGWHDWYIGSTTRDKGVPQCVRGLTDKFAYNDLSSLEALIASHPRQHAAVVLEPMNAVDPAPGFLEGLREICDREGIVLVFDEIITGFRYNLGGAQALFGVTPDLACFGKAMANGLPLAAIGGRRSLMQEMEEIFFSSTFGGEALSLAASIATIDKLEREKGIEALWSTGTALAAGFGELAKKYGLTDTVALVGKTPWKIVTFKAAGNASAEAIRTRFLIEMLQRGVLIGASHNVMVAHNAADVAQVLWAYDGAFAAIREGLDSNGLEENLPCPVIRPVFQVR
jgi:glutamate-1-semialdehyde 2,1-aminomutase